MSHLTFLNENAEYRKARNTLLAEEIALRQHIEAVAARRRALPPGGAIPDDYIFERIGENGMPEKIEMSKLFGRHNTLILYSFMYGPDRDAPCPMCTRCSTPSTAEPGMSASALRSMSGQSPVARLVAWAHERGWDHLRFLSTVGNGYDADYFGDSSKVPAAIQRMRGGKNDEYGTTPCSTCFASTMARHFWGSEFVGADGNGQDHRSGDAVYALWGLLDMTPEGRGQFMAKLALLSSRKSS